MSLEETPTEDTPKESAPIVLHDFSTFAASPLDEGLKAAVAKLGWDKPTPVQQLCLPHTTAKRDVAGFAQTGTGKTGVFLITIAQRLLEAKKAGELDHKNPVCFVLSPTRELAMQIESDASELLSSLGLSSLAVFGGVDYEKQANSIRNGIHVIVATPGRLKDYFNKKVFTLDACRIFVCDEADRMFDMGFIDDVEFFMSRIPENCQRLMFSATTSDNVKELAFEYLDKPEYISVNPESMTPENITQEAVICEAKDKLKVMLGLLRDHNPVCSIIFTNTKMTAEWLHYKLTNNGFTTDIITGDLPQRKRIQLIHRIKAGEVKALIATDVASRGLHIAGVTHVYNFDLPDEAQNYVHRVGRTARAGASGLAVSLVCEDYGHNLAPINTLLGERLTIKTKWYDPKYQDIEDKAPNPFQDVNSKLSEKPKRPGDRDRGRGGKDRDARGGRGGRDRGGRSDRGPREDQEGGQSGKPRQQQPQGRQQQGRPQQQQGRPQNQGQRPRQQQRHDQPRQSANQRPPPRTQTKTEVPASQASVGQIVKRFFSTIFGKPKK